MSKRKLATAVFTGLLAIGLVALIAVGAAWDGVPRTASARTVSLEGGVYAPVAQPPGSPAQAPGPSQVNFQGVLTNPATGAAVADGMYSIRFSVWDADTLGTELWNETQGSVSVSGGLFNVELASVDNFPTDLFNDTPRLLEVKVGADPAMTPRLPFLSVPYAFHADLAESALDALNVNCTGCVNPSDVEFNYAGSATQGGPASDVACFAPLGCVSGNEIVDNSVGSADVQFNYAASASEGGPANDVACFAPLGCVSGNEILDGQVTGSDISDTSGVGSADIVDGTITGADISDTSGVASADIVNGTVTGTDIANSTILSVNIADGTVTTLDIADSTITGTDIVNNSIAGTAITDGTISGLDVQDGSLTQTDVASSANSQLLDNVDSQSFLRSDTSDAYTAGILTLNSGTILDLRNAGGASQIRLSNNGLDGNQTICFFEVTNCGESFQWLDSAVGGPRFSVSDDFQATGHLIAGGSVDVTGGVFFGPNNVSWADGGLATISSNGNTLSLTNGVTVAGFATFNSLATFNNLDSAGATNLCRNVSNRLATCSSSARYKDDITALAFDGEKLLALRPVEFTWKDSGQPGVGLVAEEVSELIPELVTYNDKGEVEGVNYDQLTVYLLEMLKQHEKELSELRAPSGDSSVASPSTTEGFGAGQLALVLGVAAAAAAVISAGTTLVVTRAMQVRKARAS